MVLYNVTVNVEENSHEEWLQWMKDTHIPDVLATNLFTGYRIFNLLGEYHNGGVTYCIQYYLDSMANFEEYTDRHAAGLDAILNKRYTGRYVSFATVLNEV